MRIIGCMSGTSLDGLDIALCEFEKNNNIFSFKIHEAITFEYPSDWKDKLRNAPNLSGLDLSLLDNDFGTLTGNFIKQFINDNQLRDIDYIASHGHTVFHQPEKSFTLQIGSGVNIATLTQITTINDFRSKDVSLNGQGAPLVPIGDKLLFPDYDYCLNLGGFSNVSFEDNGQRIAFDIAPANLILNYYSEKLGFDFDESGKLGRSGSIIQSLLSELNKLSYYRKNFPKSLGKEWLDSEFIPLISKNLNINDILRTLYEHISIQIASVLKKENSKTLVTGGGAFNSFLIERIKKHSVSEIIIPDNRTINFKEALIFAFLAYLRVNNITNVLKSVTGANHDSCSGNIITE